MTVAFAATTAPMPLVSVCMYCKRQIVDGSGLKTVGEPLAPAINHSHGICGECLPKAFHDFGLSEADQRTILKKIRD